MADFADLEIGLHRLEGDTYSVDFRFTQPDSDTDIRLGQGRGAVAHLELNQLSTLVADPAAYGKALTDGLFEDPRLLTAYAQARTSAQSLGVPVRFRLLIGSSAPELHRLHWETLLDPQERTPLTTSQDILFSRYLSSLDWRPVRLRPKSALRALALVANPENLSEYSLAPVDVQAELERGAQRLGEHPPVDLTR